MNPLDAEILSASALVIDSSPSSRSVLCAMLRECGVGEVQQTSSAKDARRILEYRRFDIVLCERHFDGDAMTGQDLMDDLRLTNLLPLSTVVVMISGDAGYLRVAEAAEAALDAYLIKPHTEDALRQRLKQARCRKLELKEIIVLAEAERFEEAAALAEARVEVRGPSWLQAARIAAELWLRVGRPHAAQRMMDLILQTGALPWARLGLARAQYQAGSLFQARRTLESLLADQPCYADGYDVMGRVLLEQGEPLAAIDALRRATVSTPNAVTRLVKFGLLAFYYGDADEAYRALQRAAGLGANSRTYDLQGLVLLAGLQFDRGDKRDLAASRRMMLRLRAEQPGSARLRRFEEVLTILHDLAERRVADAAALLQAQFDEVEVPDFDFEAACNLLMVMARVSRSELRLDDQLHRVGRLAMRFASSRPTCELLCSALQDQADAAAHVRSAYAEVSALAEKAISCSVRGEPRDAVCMLIEAAQLAPNARYIDLALHTVERHQADIEDAPALLQQVQALHQRYRSYGTQARLASAQLPNPVAASGSDRKAVPSPL